MRTVDAVDIISGISDLCGLDRENLPASDFLQIRQSMDRRLQTAWEFDYWNELERTQKRYYRDLWVSGTSYAQSTLTVPVEVYYPATGFYYQCIKATNSVAPADSNGDENSSNWAESKNSYNPADFSASTTYAVGDQVYYPTTDRSYQLHTSAVAGTLPTDTTKWGVLTDFDRYIAFEQTGQTAIGTVIGVYSLNPKTTTRLEEYDWFLSENGIQVTTPSSFAYVVFKIRTPRIRGSLWVDGDSYETGDQVYYSTEVPGNFYDCIDDTSSDAPTVTANWSVTEIPLIFQRYLELGGHADWLRNNGQSERADAAEVLASKELSDQSALLVSSQSQRNRTVVHSR